MLIGEQDLREVRLYGHLAQRFGRVHVLAVKSCREAVQALCCLLPGFERAILQRNEPGYHVFGGARKAANCRTVETLDGPLGSGEPVCIVPAVAGSKKQGVLQTVLGIALIVYGAFTGNAAAVQAGIALVVGGVVQLLTPTPKAPDDPKDSRLASYVFDGPVNSTQMGMPVPVVLGRFIVGSQVISQGIHANDIA